MENRLEQGHKKHAQVRMHRKGEKGTKMNWERRFQHWILDRGYDYYLREAVKNMKVTEDCITADVMGTESYEVEIFLEDGEVAEMYCSCPYAEEGKNCKHMAAVLYEWSEEEKQGTASDMQDQEWENFDRREEIRAWIQETDPEIVTEFLTNLLAEDEQLWLQFRTLSGEENLEQDLQPYAQQIDEIAWRYLGRDGFISYYDARGFISELDDILSNDVRAMVDQQDYGNAFQVLNYILGTLGTVDMDDSDGGTGYLADEIYEYWQEILSCVSHEEKAQMFDWLASHLTGSILDYLEEYIERILLNAFPEDEYRQRKLGLIEKEMQEAVRQTDPWTKDYELEKWVPTYLAMLEEMGEEEKIDAVYRQYWEYSPVRRYYINQCMEKKEYDQALEALDDSIQRDQTFLGLISDYEQKKKEIYRLQGNKEKYLRQLWKLELQVLPADLEIYRELKEQYSKEEWLQKREELFEKLPARAHADQLYQEEKMYDRLLDYVMESIGIFGLQQYGDVLQEHYPKEILEKYKMELETMVIHSGDRKKYQYLVSILRSMKGIKGGAQVVDQIIEEWRRRYRNRPAMMDELSRL